MKNLQTTFILGFVITIVVLGMVLTTKSSKADSANGVPGAPQPANGTNNLPGKEEILSEPQGPHPKIIFDEESHDFGNQISGSELKYTFLFHNKGDSLLIIDSVKASCGCTAAVASTKEIAPGVEGKIDVTFKPGKASGQTSKTVTVKSNDPVNPAKALQIKANIEIYFDAKPDRLHLGQVKRSEKKETFVEFTGIQLDKIKIKNIAIKPKDQTNQPDVTKSHDSNLNNQQSSSADSQVQSVVSGLSWKLDDNRTKEGGTLKLNVTFDPSKLKPGRFDDTLIIETNDEKVAKLEIPIAGEILGSLTAEPQKILFSNFDASQEMVRPVTIESYNEKAFKILSATSSNPNFTIKNLDKESKASHTIDVELKKNVTEDQFAGDLVLKTDYSEQKEITIQMHAMKKHDLKDIPVSHLDSIDKNKSVVPPASLAPSKSDASKK
jgi:hypothetical protein